MGLFSSQGSTQASNGYQQAFNTAGMLGGQASGISSNLTPFLTQMMLHPQGLGQQGLSAEEAAATGAAGGAGSAFNGMMAQRAGASRNAGGFQAGMDAASRNAAKAAAGASERIAAGNQNLMQQQQQEGAAGLGSEYKTDTSGMLNAMGQEAGDVNAETNALQNDGFNNLLKGLNTAGSLASGAGGLMTGLYGAKGALSGCWVAAELYGGWDDPRVHLLRRWIFTEFVKSKFGRVLASLYHRYGECTAEAIRRHPMLRKPFRALFDCALRKAIAWQM